MFGSDLRRLVVSELETAPWENNPLLEIGLSLDIALRFPATEEGTARFTEFVRDYLRVVIKAFHSDRPENVNSGDELRRITIALQILKDDGNVSRALEEFLYIARDPLAKAKSLQIVVDRQRLENLKLTERVQENISLKREAELRQAELARQSLDLAQAKTHMEQLRSQIAVLTKRCEDYKAGEGPLAKKLVNISKMASQVVPLQQEVTVLAEELDRLVARVATSAVIVRNGRSPAERIARPENIRGIYGFQISGEFRSVYANPRDVFSIPALSWEEVDGWPVLRTPNTALPKISSIEQLESANFAGLKGRFNGARNSLVHWLASLGSAARLKVVPGYFSLSADGLLNVDVVSERPIGRTASRVLSAKNLQGWRVLGSLGFRPAKSIREPQFRASSQEVLGLPISASSAVRRLLPGQVVADRPLLLAPAVIHRTKFVTPECEATEVFLTTEKLRLPLALSLFAVGVER